MGDIGQIDLPVGTAGAANMGRRADVDRAVEASCRNDQQRAAHPHAGKR